MSAAFAVNSNVNVSEHNFRMATKRTTMIAFTKYIE